ncbi:2693_t:CDS:2, partial [Gigaspora margarita]
KEKSVEKQIVVNTLEDSNNGCWVIFVVNKLNEDSKNNVPGPTTIREAQLIERGARYYSVKTDNSDNAHQRKFDCDIQNEMQILKNYIIITPTILYLLLTI